MKSLMEPTPPREAFFAVAISFSVFMSLNVFAQLRLCLNRAQSIPSTIFRTHRISPIVCLSQGLLLVGRGLVIAQPVIIYQELKQAGTLSLGSEVSHLKPVRKPYASNALQFGSRAVLLKYLATPYGQAPMCLLILQPIACSPFGNSIWQPALYPRFQWYSFIMFAVLLVTTLGAAISWNL